MTSERENKPSSSDYESLRLCLGKFHAEQGLPDVSTPCSERGNRIHNALAGRTENLSVEEDSIYNSCVLIEEKILENLPWEKEFITRPETREKRLWLVKTYPENTATFEQKVERVFSGQADVIYENGKEAAIFDYKSLRGDVAVSSKNLQLRSLAALYYANNPNTRKVYVSVIQPLVTHNPEIVCYTKEYLQKGLEILIEDIKKIQPGAHRTAGEKQCKFCKAKSECQTHLEWINRQEKHLATISPRSIVDRHTQISYWKQAKKIKNLLDNAIKQFVSQVKENPQDWPELEVEEGRGNREIFNPQLAKDITNEFVSHEEFMSCVDVRVGKLEEIFVENYRKKYPKETIKYAKELFDQGIAGAVVYGKKTTVKEKK